MNVCSNAGRRCFLPLLLCCSFFALWSLLPVAAAAQGSGTRTITGRVIDAVTKEPLVGATVWLKDTSVGRTTDADGKFTIPFSGMSGTIEVSYVGYEKVALPITQRDNMNFQLKPDSGKIDEVVVVGYGIQRKESVIGSISSVKGSDLKTPTGNLSNSLAGQVNGLVVIQRNGEPGSNADFWIRGINTINGTKTPLVLVDGVERSLDLVDSEDIESFSILKDAAATAIYGVRGANGVILITTRTGYQGAPKISIRAEAGVVQPTKIPRFVNSVQFADLYNEVFAAENNGELKYLPEEIQKYRDGSDPDLYPNVNWIDELFKDVSFNQRVSANISGGGTIARYFVSASFYNEGSIFGTDNMRTYDSSINYKKFSFRSNLDINLSPTTIMTVSFANIYETKVRPGSNQIWNTAFITSPNAIPVRYSDGSYSSPEVSSGNNPWNLLTQSGYIDYVKNTAQTLVGVNQDLGPHITKGLSVNAKFSWDAFNSQELDYMGEPNTYIAQGRNPDGSLNLKEVSKGRQFLKYDKINNGYSVFYLEASINYNRTFDRHRVSAMFLYNQKSRRNFPMPKSDANDNSAALESVPYRNQGIAGRMTYSFDDRYFVEGNFGYNGSENFSPGKRFGFFPSAALGWVVSNEKFFGKWRNTVDILKLRASYGKVGSDKIGADRRFIYYGTFESVNNAYNFGDSGNSYGGLRMGDIANNAVSWEESLKFDAGIELGLFNSLHIQADYFNDHRRKMFMKRDDISWTAGVITLPWVNVGEMVNRGFDVEADYTKQISKDFVISARGNFTYNRNKVINDAQPKWNYAYRDAKNRPYDQQSGLIALGLFESQEEIDNSPTQTFGPVRVGDIKYKDLNGDGKIDVNDETSIGHSWLPEIQYGFGASLQYKNFDFSFLFQGSARVSVMLQGQAVRPYTSGNLVTSGYFKDVYDNIWREGRPDPNAEFPRASTKFNQNNYRNSTFWQRDAGYLRLKNAQIGYTLPKSLTKKIGIDAIRIYLSGVNLLTFSDFDLFDPELVSAGQGAGYPPTRIYNLGININF